MSILFGKTRKSKSSDDGFVSATPERCNGKISIIFVAKSNKFLSWGQIQAADGGDGNGSLEVTHEPGS